ncbi:MAG: DNA-directed RNA polymerase subunit H [Thaumarchaeota archaeon]|nr:DNA-directed RNA polymerase subunit H [Nitrososphaerota archaeon]
MGIAPTKGPKAPAKKTVRRKKVEDEVPPFKVSTHFLIPKHELLTKEESAQVLARYNSSPGQFPYILSTDALAKEIGAKPGDLVRITRNSETAGTSTYYRYVVES